MFGYIKPDNPYLFMKDDTLYRALYCGVCKSIGGTCGQVARFTLTYDIAFLSAIAHNIMNKDVAIEHAHCVIHPITKRPIAARDELSDTLANVNVILAYHKLLDDVYDEGKGRLGSVVFKRAYKKAKKSLPEVDEVVRVNYKNLYDLEKGGADSVDMVCDPFAVMLAGISDHVLGEYKNEFTYKLFYYVGKWIYLIDALDDYDKDVKKNDYNVYKLAYKSINAQNLVEEHGEELASYFNVVFSEIADCFKNIKFYFNADLVGNILLRGIPEATRKIIERIKNKNVGK